MDLSSTPAGVFVLALPAMGVVLLALPAMGVEGLERGMSGLSNREVFCLAGAWKMTQVR